MAGPSSGAIRAGSAFVELFVKSNQFTRGLDGAQKRFQQFGSMANAVGARLMGLGGLTTAPIVAAFTAMIDKFDAVKKASDRLGHSAESVSALGYAAKISGASFEDMESGAAKLQKTIVEAADGSAEAQEALAKLGLTAADLKGKDLVEQFALIADGLQEIAEGEKGPAIIAAMGKSAKSLLPMMKGGAAGIREMAAEAKKVGDVISSKDAADAERAGDAIGRAWDSLKNTFIAVGAALLPQLDNIERFSDAVVELGGTARSWIGENRELVLTVLAVGAAITAAGAVFVGLGSALAIGAFAIGGFKAALLGLGAVLGVVFSPVGLGVLAIVGATAAILEFTAAATGSGGIKGVLGDIGQTFKDTFQGVKDALSAGDWQLAFDIILAGMKVAWKSFIDTIWKSTQTLWQQLKKEVRDVSADAALARGKKPEDAAWYDEIATLSDEFDREVLGGKDRAASGPLVKGPDGKTRLSAADAALADAVKKNSEALEASKKAYEDAIAEIMKPSAELEALKKRLAELNAQAAEKARPAPIELGPMPREQIAKIPDAVAKVASSAKGTFSGAADFRSLGLGESVQVQEKQLNVQKQIKKGIDDLNAKKGSDVIFGP